MMEEAKVVAAAYGVHIAMSAADRIDIARKLGSAKISKHQDVERGRPLEVDAIIGAVVELARKAKVPTPMIDGLRSTLALTAPPFSEAVVLRKSCFTSILAYQLPLTR